MSLPSIHEMFPDHVLRTDIRRSVSYTRSTDPLPIQPTCRHSGCNCMAESSSTANGRFKPKPHSEDDPSIGVNNLDALGRKHVCPTCCKRFNRPSSLRIHLNTHTGATPFKCPWPNCGREFNVNSNMRRHYRNHMSPARIQVLSAHGHGTPPPAAYQFQTDPNGLGISSVVPDRQQHIPDLRHNMHGPPVHGPPDPPHPSVTHTQHQRSIAPNSRLCDNKPNGDPVYSHYRPPSPSLSRSHHSERPHHSASYSPPPGERWRYLPEPSRSSLRPKYNPSKPYLESLKDPRVSTTLRPAFK